MLEALREGGPWKSKGGGSRAGAGCLGDSGLGFGLGFWVGETGEVGDFLRSSGLPIDQTGEESGANAMLWQRPRLPMQEGCRGNPQREGGGRA